jgi:hypothetical protein
VARRRKMTMERISVENGEFSTESGRKVTGKPIGLPDVVFLRWFSNLSVYLAGADFLHYVCQKAPQDSNSFLLGMIVTVEGIDDGWGHHSSRSFIPIQYYRILD